MLSHRRQTGPLRPRKTCEHLGPSSAHWRHSLENIIVENRLGFLANHKGLSSLSQGFRTCVRSGPFYTHNVRTSWAFDRPSATFAHKARSIEHRTCFVRMTQRRWFRAFFTRITKTVCPSGRNKLVPCPRARKTAPAASLDPIPLRVRHRTRTGRPLIRS